MIMVLSRSVRQRDILAGVRGARGRISKVLALVLPNETSLENVSTGPSAVEPP